jgi:hypothetical protein
MSVLGAMLQYDDALAHCSKLLEPHHFYFEGHRRIFIAVRDLITRGERVDVVIVTNELRRRGELDDVGSSGFLTALVASVPTAANVKSHVKIIVDTARARRIAELSLQVHQAAAADDGWSALMPSLLTAMKAEGARESGFAFRRLSLASIDPNDPPSVQYVLSPLLARGDIAILAGAWGAGKTWLVLDLLLAGASGGKVWGRYAFERPIRVMLVDEDLGTRRTTRWLAELAKGRGFDRETMAGLDERILLFSDAGFNFRNREAMTALLAEVDRFGPDLVCMDSLIRVQGASDENASVEAHLLFAEGLRPVARERGIAILITHHFRKRSALPTLDEPGERVRGSSGILDLADQVYALVKTENDNETRFIHIKTREAKRSPDIIVKLEVPEHGGVIVTSELAPAGPQTETGWSKGAAAKRFCLKELADAGDQGLPREELLRLGVEKGFSETTVKRAVRSLLHDGTIEATSRDRGAPLRLAEEGK